MCEKHIPFSLLSGKGTFSVKWMTSEMSLYLPSRSRFFIALSIGLILVGVVVGLMFAGNGTLKDMTFGFFMTGIVFMGGAAVMLEIATLTEKRIPAKAALGVATMLVALLALVITSVMLFIQPNSTHNMEFVGGLMCFGLPILAIFAAPTVFAMAKLPDALREHHETNTERTVQRFLKRNEGEADLKLLAEHLKQSDEETVDLLLQMLEDGTVKGHLEPQFGRFFTDETYQQKQDRLLGIINTQGSVHLEDLAIELNEPAGLIRRWIYSLVQNRRFTGYANWDQGILYSADAQAIKSTGRCPNCGGEQEIVGKGVIQCKYCGAEIFIS
jgi:hypothetical protein